MATTITGTGVTFTSGNTQTEAVQTTHNGIGTYTIAMPIYTSDSQFNRITVGGTSAGSDLRQRTQDNTHNGNLGFQSNQATASGTSITTAFASIVLSSQTKSSKGLTGTWRLMSGAWGTDGIGNSEMVRGSYLGLWVRIS